MGPPPYGLEVIKRLVAHELNDRFGHLTGDQVLRLVAVSLKQIVKGQNIVARYGGEEFVIALPKTALGAAITVAEQIRRAVMSKELMKRSSGERLGRVTISIGVASLRPADSPQSLIDRADACLYAAKRGGRNQVVGECEINTKGSVVQAATARIA
jgi:diguanylate cyclase